MARGSKKSSEEELDYGRDMEIDVHALETECVRQPVLFNRYAAPAAKADRAAKLAEERVKTIRSNVVLQVSKDHRAFGFDKAPTGGQIEAIYRTDLEYLKAKEELIEAQYERDMLQVGVGGMRQRKDMLQELVRLYLSDYYSNPSVSKAVKEAGAEEQEERVRDSFRQRKTQKEDDNGE